MHALRPFSLNLFLRLLAWTICSVLSTACTTLHSPPPTALSVDLSRYSGLWHEIARLPMWAQRHCGTSTAEYRMLDSGEIGVKNACTTASGDQISIQGTATIVDPVNRAKLFVIFDQWAAKLVAFFSDSSQGNYWILHVDPTYQVALVGTPDREFLWILARTPSLDDSTYQNLVARAHDLGYPIDQLLHSKQIPHSGTL